MKTIAIFLLLFPSLLFGAREPVLKQIDVPHNYYYREMYLPQVTTGPSSVSWSPDGKSLTYSMHGSIWIQNLDSDVAQEVTAGPGYDYQPDWSPDGKSIVFVRYNNDAMELQLLDIATGKVIPLTSGGAVNVEPRWSPDGTRIVFVSTQYNKRFHIFMAYMNGGSLNRIEQLTEERRSKITRYYYSPFDHELSPTWSPDGTELIFISNPERYYGTGGFWRMKAEKGAERREIRFEETTWKAKPDWSSDGKRVIYSSYLGRPWHQIWIMTSDGGDPFPLTYGEYDNTAPRWSRDAKQIAFVSNRNGNTSLWVMNIPGGKQRQIIAKEKKWLRPMATLKISVTDQSGKPMSARISVTAEDQRAYAPDDAWMHADDGFDRAVRPFEVHYFHTQGNSTVTIPTGKILVEVMSGFEYRLVQQDVSVTAGETKPVKFQLQPHMLPERFGKWYSGDLHVHMNYAGTYRNVPEQMLAQAKAENLNVVNNLIVNKEQRIPDMAYYSDGKPDAASTDRNILLHEQEYHTSYWGHLGLLNLKEFYVMPDYSGYTNTGAASLYPTNAAVADLVHEQGGLVGYVHPWDWDPDPAKEEKLTNELPIDVALGKVDYYEVVGFSDHIATAHVWYRLLNCGFRLAVGGGTDAMANYASLRGPVGTNRAYIKLDGKLNADDWLQNLKNGRTFASNSALLGFTVQGKIAGDEIKLPAGAHELKFDAAMRSIVPMDHVEIVFNGKPVKQLSLSSDKMSADEQGSIQIDRSGWLVLRTCADRATDPVLDLYPYATTGAIYVTVDNQPVRSNEDADYFLKWIDRIQESAEKHPDYNFDWEKNHVMEIIQKARQEFLKRKT
jgi:Tol biopolymer transport system component